MSKIQNFYRDKVILITGGTGFLGKLLVEKLLRSCSELKLIYLLIRDKKGQSAKDRMEIYFEDQVFQRMKLENPNYRLKIKFIKGNIENSNLNLSEEDMNILTNNINIIFHAAATVNFNQKLRLAINVNVNGIKQVINLSKKMTKLNALVHISTVYSNCQLKEIDEKIYNYNITYQEITHLTTIFTDEELEKMMATLIGQGPNTYTFTKALAESYISDNCDSLPVGIFRPAIVISTANEPIPGWIDNFYGPTGLLASAAFGFLHTMHGNKDVFSNIVPADMVVNAIIASSWEISQNRKRLPIYNFVSTQNPLTWGEYVQLTKKGLNYPFSGAIWYMSLILTKHKWLFEFYKLFLHLIPAFLADTACWFLNQKPRYLKKYEKIHKYVDVLSYFANTEWRFKNDNILSLWKSLDKNDKQLFNFDVTTIDWNEYFTHYIKGIRMYLLKDDLSNLESARKNYNRLFWMHQIFKYGSFILTLFYFWSIFS